jgi:hypothetical protein
MGSQAEIWRTTAEIATSPGALSFSASILCLGSSDEGAVRSNRHFSGFAAILSKEVISKYGGQVQFSQKPLPQQEKKTHKQNPRFFPISVTFEAMSVSKVAFSSSLRALAKVRRFLSPFPVVVASCWSLFWVDPVAPLISVDFASRSWF